MQRIARLGVRSIEEHLDSGNVSTDETGSAQSLRRPFQVILSQKHIDVLSVPDRRGIDGRDPSRDGVAANDRIRNPGTIQRRRSPQQSITHAFHAQHHPV